MTTDTDLLGLPAVDDLPEPPPLDGILAGAFAHDGEGLDHLIPDAGDVEPDDETTDAADPAAADEADDVDLSDLDSGASGAAAADDDLSDLDDADDDLDVDAGIDAGDDFGAGYADPVVDDWSAAPSDDYADSADAADPSGAAVDDPDDGWGDDALS